MGTIVAGDGTVIFFPEHGAGAPIVFSHDWPLDGDAWAAQMASLRQHGHRVIAHHRRGHGRSGHPATGHGMDTCADDLAALMRALDLSFTQDLEQFNVPALFIHGNDDRVVPLARSAAIAVKLARNGILKVHRAAPHGLCTTHADDVSAAIVSFLAD